MLQCVVSDNDTSHALLQTVVETTAFTTGQSRTYARGNCVTTGGEEVGRWVGSIGRRGVRSPEELGTRSRSGKG